MHSINSLLSGAAHKYTPQTLWKELPPSDEEDGKYESLLRQAIETWQEKMFRGLGALTEEEIQERLELFKARFHPGEDAPEEKLNMFYKTLMEYEQLLRCTENNDMLITTASDEDKDTGGSAATDFLRSRLPSNQELRDQLTNPQSEQTGTAARRGFISS